MNDTPENQTPMTEKKKSYPGLKSYVKGQSGNPSGRAKGMVTYPKAIRLACERIAAKRGITDPTEVYMEIFTKAVEEALDGNEEFHRMIVDKLYPGESKKDQINKTTNNTVFVLSQDRRDELYRIASMHNAEEGNNRSLGPGDSRGTEGGL